jgi:hypothetical protein
MKELTFGELKRGLICCTVYKNCTGCPLYMGGDLGTASAGDLTCTDMLLSAAMNCINVMEKDLKEANQRARSWEQTAEAHEREIIGLHESLDRK